MARAVPQLNGESPIFSRDTVVHLTSRAFSLAVELARHELHLAKIETRRKAKTAGLGLAVIGAAAMIAFLGLLGLIATAVLALCLVIPPWAATLVVAGGLISLAGAIVIIGKEAIVRAAPPIPTEAIENGRLSLKMIRERVMS